MAIRWEPAFARVATRGSDLLMALGRSSPETPVGQVITRDPQVAEAGEPLEEVLRRMREHRRSALPVVSGGRLVGMVTLENVSELLLVQEALRRRPETGGAGDR